MGDYKDKGGCWYVYFRSRNWLGNHPAKPRENLQQSEMRWHGNGSLCENPQAVWI